MVARIYIWSFLIFSFGIALVSCSENAVVNQEAFGSIIGKVVDTTGSAIGNAIMRSNFIKKCMEERGFVKAPKKKRVKVPAKKRTSPAQPK